jgi:GT2 family glycosyltransferase
MRSLTVIIPTFNRPEKLKLGLAALAVQTDKNFSIIVVDDGSTEENREKYKEVLSTTAIRYKFISQQNKGISGATNAGIADAPDGLIILTDDDILPPPTFIEHHRKHHEIYPGSILTGKALFDLSLAKTDVQRYKNFMDEEWIRILFPGNQKLVRISMSNFSVTAANMSFEKKLFLRTGIFREDLKDCQDFEFGLRAYKIGINIYYDLNLIVYHNDPITLKYYSGRQKSYTRFKEKALEFHPEYSVMQNSLPENKTPGKNLFYDFLARESTTDFIEHSILFRFLPRFLRYKIYGATIAALSRTDYGN